jgi:hypothetical protein
MRDEIAQKNRKRAWMKQEWEQRKIVELSKRNKEAGKEKD